MSKPDYLWDRTGAPDPDVARMEQLLAPLAHDRPLDELRVRRSSRRAVWIAGIVVAAAAAAVFVIVLRGRGASEATCGAGHGMAFVAHGGEVTCGGGLAARGVLPVGETLDTGAHRAQLAIASIGTAELFEGTRVRLDRTEPARHQLHLERGRMHARVIAPPRIFAITTPSTNVVDLGCEYTVEIDEAGRGSIIVQSGKVELEGAAGVVVAPAGTTTRLLAGRRASLPLAETASAELRAAVVALEAGATGAIERVVAAVGDEDAITLTALVDLAPPERRPELLARLAELVAPPEGVSIEGAARDAAERGRWRDQVVDVHIAQHVLRASPSPHK
jgi:hypothetical protein